MSVVNKNHVELSEDDIELICKRYLLSINCDNFKFFITTYDIRPFSEYPCEDFVQHFILKVLLHPKKVGYTKDAIKKVDDELSFFIKNRQHESKFLKGVFAKEINMYQFLIPRLQDVGIIHKYNWAPRCFLIRKDNYLVFENLSKIGYRLIKNIKMALFDFQHMKIAIETLARFHASSIILEQRNHISILHSYSACLIEYEFPSDENNFKVLCFNNSVNILLDMIRMISKYGDEKSYKTVCDEFPKLMKQIFEFVKPSKQFRNVVNHGDLISNNLLFKYGEAESEEVHKNFFKRKDSFVVECEIHLENNCNKVTSGDNNEKCHFNGCEIPIEARLVDFEYGRYAPPAYDFMVLLSSTSDTQFRELNFKNLSEIYYTALRTELSWHEIDLEDIIKMKEFEQSCEFYKLAGLIEGCLSSLRIVRKEALDDDSNKLIYLNSFNTDSEYRNRMTDALSQLIDNYVLIDLKN